MRRAAGHREVAEAAPYLVPRDLALGVILQSGRAHRRWLHGFVGLVVLGRQQRLEPRVELLLRVAFFVDHPISFPDIVYGPGFVVRLARRSCVAAEVEIRDRRAGLFPDRPQLAQA